MQYYEIYAFLSLYAFLLTSHLGYCVQCWLSQDMKDMEKNPEIAIGMLKIWEIKSHGEQLKEVGMFTLMKRRLLWNMTSLVKYVKDCYMEEGVDLFSIGSKGRTRMSGGFTDGSPNLK